MPELPDLQVFAKNLTSLFAGKRLQQINVVSRKNLKDDPKELETALNGQALKRVFRSGKELRFEFENNAVLGMHLMLHGKLYLFDEKNENKYTIAEFHFKNKGLALTDFQDKANMKLNPQDKAGMDAMSDKLDVGFLKEALASKTKIKKRITDQAVIRGIGNAYADEILWEARIHPNSVSNKIPDSRIGHLATAIQKVLSEAEKEILQSKPDIIAGEVRHFLKIHNSKMRKSPEGADIMVDKKGSTTYYTNEQELFV